MKSDGQQFHKYQQKRPISSHHNSMNIKQQIPGRMTVLRNCGIYDNTSSFVTTFVTVNVKLVCYMLKTIFLYTM